MISAVVIFASVVVLAASVLLYRLAGGEIAIGKLNMLSYSFYVLLMHAWFGAVIITINEPFSSYDPAGFTGVDNPALRWEMWVWLMWMFIGIPTGALLMTWARRTGSMKVMFSRFRASPVHFETNEWALFVAFSIFAGIFLVITFYRLAEQEALPIFSALRTQDVEQTLILRRGFKLSNGFFSEVTDTIFSSSMIAWMSYAAYAAATVTKKPRWWAMFFVTLVACLVLFVVNTSIAPTFTYLVGFMLVRVMLGQRPIRLVEIATGLSLLVAMEIYFKNQDGGLIAILEKTIVGRIMTGQLIGLYYAKQVFPGVENFIGFDSTGGIIHEILGLPSSASYGIVTMRHYNALAVEAGTAGHMTTNFMGEAWANFGYVGLVIAPLWVGAFVQVINVWFLSRPKDVARIALYALLTTNFGYHTDFISFYYPVGTIFTVLGVAMVMLFARMLLGKETTA